MDGWGRGGEDPGREQRKMDRNQRNREDNVRRERRMMPWNGVKRG